MDYRKLLLASTAIALMGVSASAHALTVTGRVDGVDYSLSNMSALTGNMATFELIVNTSGYMYAGTGFLTDVNIKVSSDVDLTGSSLVAPTGWGNSLAESSLNNSADANCTGSGSGFLCSNASTPLTTSLGPTYTFTFLVDNNGSGWIDPVAPSSWHIGAFYRNNSGYGEKIGAIASIQGAVPEPEIYAMMGLGLGLLGWVGRRKNLQAA